MLQLQTVVVALLGQLCARDLGAHAFGAPVTCFDDLAGLGRAMNASSALSCSAALSRGYCCTGIGHVQATLARPLPNTPPATLTRVAISKAANVFLVASWSHGTRGMRGLNHSTQRPAHKEAA